jgi:hypothetical protein
MRMLAHTYAHASRYGKKWLDTPDHLTAVPASQVYIRMS